jgi:hypothetical protein
LELVSDELWQERSNAVNPTAMPIGKIKDFIVLIIYL